MMAGDLQLAVSGNRMRYLLSPGGHNRLGPQKGRTN